MGDRKQARDEEFQRFVIGRWPRLMRTAFLLTGEQHAAEDLVQTTLEQVYVAWRRVGAADDPEAYVRRVMINAHARKHRRRLKEFLAPKDDSGLTHELPDHGDRIAQADDRSALLTALVQLPPRQREAVVLRYWEDLSESQAAEAMGCSVGAVKSNAAKGLAKLRAIPGLADMVTHGGRK
ncbi:SigE family RNA polymerase sigma factor [Streptomyces sp. NBC_01340]|jgi:RNA polymerase sigma-70 factor (sigma-E family)|uniref:SigE family RNA polymerase sigma factor n=1 Tax=unclassified Streptomyces TaxID=2593676 RepID=UPI0022530EF8|nr:MULTISPECIES: SigE family RNA polymerase sigma factor [unclassified Streptomyces]MCX4401077.1 SigE family RNA polymerase sigma factor [Streptomyces sp. NBC_01764]MCX4453747.1 SigE family RNA polymerase sigma factor [Streptomyces sp. NBC_01719]MCX4493107.1 SigE family RNA polymerase sigma factor [Streptomyces sp. NBC_01728]MCX4592385.1 SigE family RNA polymerase sigma factor [Streptomyces sp. NBC_01549]WSI38253.1 SigE family RNA polymerase sigma factor [Streptomyces sp. NBC_01340]